MFLILCFCSPFKCFVTLIRIENSLQLSQRFLILDWIHTEHSRSFWLRPFLTGFFASHASLDLPSLCGSQVGCKIPAGRKMKTYDGKYPTCRRNWSLIVTSSACPEGNQDLNWPVVSRVNFTPSAAELNVNWRTASLTKPCQTTAVPNDTHSVSESCTHFVIALIC